MSKIAITANTSWYLYNFRKNTILSLINEGYNVVAIAPFDRYSEKLKQLGCHFLDIKIDQGGTNPIKDLRTISTFYSIYRNSDITCVLNFTPKNNIYSTLAASVLGIKTINNIAGLGVLFINETLTSKVARALYKSSQRRASKIFFQNKEDLTLFLNGGYADASVTDCLPVLGLIFLALSILHRRMMV